MCGHHSYPYYTHSHTHSFTPCSIHLGGGVRCVAPDFGVLIETDLKVKCCTLKDSTKNKRKRSKTSAA